MAVGTLCLTGHRTLQMLTYLNHKYQFTIYVIVKLLLNEDDRPSTFTCRGLYMNSHPLVNQ